MRLRLFRMGEENKNENDPSAPLLPNSSNSTTNLTCSGCGGTLRMWYIGYSIFLLVYLIFAATMYGYRYRNQNSLTTTRMGTPLTQTVGLWVPGSATVNHTYDDMNFGGMSLSGRCRIFRNDTQLFSTMYVRPVILTVNSMNLDTGLFMLVYFAISFALYGYMAAKDPPFYYKPLNEGKYNVVSHLQMMLTVPFLFVILCAQMGITDISIVLLTVSNAFACMVFRLLTEELSNSESCIVWRGGKVLFFYEITHFGSWFTLIFAFVPLVLTINASDLCFGVNGAFYNVIESVVFIEGGLLFLLLLIQFYSIEFGPKFALDNEGRRRYAYNIEFASAFIDVWTKTFLCSMIYPVNFATNV